MIMIIINICIEPRFVLVQIADTNSIKYSLIVITLIADEWGIGIFIEINRNKVSNVGVVILFQKIENIELIKLQKFNIL